MDTSNGNVAIKVGLIAATIFLLWLVNDFVIALVLALVFAALSHPLYLKILCLTSAPMCPNSSI